MSHLRFFTILAVLSVAIAVSAHAQWRQLPTTGSETERVPDRTYIVGQSGTGPTIHARLVAENQNAKAHKIVISVETWGVDLVSPEPNVAPRLNQAHIEYYLDKNEPLISVDKTAVFTGVGNGRHVITVLLADSHRNIIGMRQTLNVEIP